MQLKPMPPIIWQAGGSSRRSRFVRFLVDECLSRHFVLHLQAAGYDATWVQDVCPSAVDKLVLERATAEGRIVLSEDWDFGELTVRLRLPTTGVVIAVIGSFDGTLDDIARSVVAAIQRLGTSCEGHLTIIEPHRVRQRPINFDAGNTKL
jgi:predicted nuclease of predicted toxin-antitoxin system